MQYKIHRRIQYATRTIRDALFNVDRSVFIDPCLRNSRDFEMMIFDPQHASHLSFQDRQKENGTAAGQPFIFMTLVLAIRYLRP